MSASLVGSEMCIRDRGSGSPPRPVPNPQQLTQKNAASSLQQFRTVSSAVSYTHLTLPTICSV
eukprot:6582627-Alexandrium_andersonii.AAC.1